MVGKVKGVGLLEDETRAYIMLADGKALDKAMYRRYKLDLPISRIRHKALFWGLDVEN